MAQKKPRLGSANRVATDSGWAIAQGLGFHLADDQVQEGHDGQGQGERGHGAAASSAPAMEEDSAMSNPIAVIIVP